MSLINGRQMNDILMKNEITKIKGYMMQLNGSEN
jgi:hypothetical protein